MLWLWTQSNPPLTQTTHQLYKKTHPQNEFPGVNRSQNKTIRLCKNGNRLSLRKYYGLKTVPL